MVDKLDLKNKHLSLIVMALLTGIIWRAEVEWYGWHGLIWLSYFHYALPLNFLIVLVWINLNLPEMTKIKRVGLNLSAIMYTLLVYGLIMFFILYMMTPGPVGMYYHFQLPRWLAKSLVILPFLVIGGYPLGVYGILRLLKFKSGYKYVIASIILYLASFPIAMWLLDIVNHKGGDNEVHAIKSGFVFPLLVFSQGLLIVGIGNEKTSIRK